MYQNDLITIVVPVHNGEMYLKENIESILSQSYENVEIIYVCDGCTDNTVNILMNYIDDYRLKIHAEEENKGAAFARNIGMNQANGEWIIFLDADDLFEADMLEKMYKKAVENEADICCCYWECFDDEPQKDVAVNNEFRKLLCESYPVIETFKELNNIMQIIDKGPCTKLVHKTIYKKEDVYFQNIPNANDVYYSMATIINSRKIVFIDEVLLHYRSNKNRKTLTTERTLKRNYVLEAYNEVYQYIVKKHNTWLLRSFYNAVISIICEYKGWDVYNYLIESMKNEYFVKWKMNNSDIVRELSYFNRIVYKNVYSENDFSVSSAELNLQAKEEWIREKLPEGCSIWGTGYLGEKILKHLSNTNIQINHVYDSNTSNWGKNIYGYTVESFKQNQEDSVIITTPKYFNEIRDQINNKVKNIYNLEYEILKIPN